jgi:hypothetical protein
MQGPPDPGARQIEIGVQRPGRRIGPGLHLFEIDVRQGGPVSLSTPGAMPTARSRPSGDGPGPMGTFQDKTSMDRILFAVFSHENKSRGVSAPFVLTHNN